MNKVTAHHTDLSKLLYKFFCYYLVQQRRLSNHTISAYRDSLKLYLSFLSDKLKRPVAMLSLNDIDRESAIEFLQYLEVVRNNSVRTRNNRLAAIRCFLNYVAGDSPSAMLQVSEILSIPQKRWDKPLVRQRLLVAQKRAIQRCPSLDKLKISPHTLRHTTAMSLLQSGVDLSLIALWLGHEQLDTTHQYMEANLEMKKIALKSLKPIETGDINRFLQPSDAVLAFLEKL